VEEREQSYEDMNRMRSQELEKGMRQGCLAGLPVAAESRPRISSHTKKAEKEKERRKEDKWSRAFDSISRKSKVGVRPKLTGC